MKTAVGLTVAAELLVGLACLAGLAGCASQPPCLAYETRDVQSTQYTRGYGSYTTTRSVRVCTARAES